MQSLDVLPGWFALDPATIKADSLIRGDQVAALGGETAMTETIERRIPEAGAFVIGRLQTTALDQGLIADFDDDLFTVLSLRQKTEAMAAGRMVVIAMLHGVMPNEKNQSAAKAILDGRGEAVIGMARLGSALSYIESLENQLITLAKAKSKSNGVGAAAIKVERADDDDCTEYGRRR